MNRRPLALALTIAGALARLVPHPWNFAPVGGTSVFAGARLRGWQAYLLPIVLMAVTDPLVGGYSVVTPFVYGSFLINVWIGRRLRNSESPMRIGAAAVISSVQFFLISNFGTWLGYYPHTWAGLTRCFTLAIPYYAPTLLSDVLTCGVLFGLHAWLSRTVYTPERVAQAA
ncbi:MAG TPA: DUF6580 family putative transport protein [Bryobacteraceae bacterium]|nr:DUF6580 family putative transport protein [Bryobacteraceae bacterium]